MEKMIKSIGAYSKTCISCERHGKDVMISYLSKEEEGEGAVDLFLDQQQAKNLLQSLG